MSRYPSPAGEGTYTSAPSGDDRARVHAAIEAWARSVRGAPRRFTELITGVEARDQVIERVATLVVRRDVHEERLPTNQRRLSSRRVSPEVVDPFAVSPDALRADSEHVAPCVHCHGTGMGRCPECSGCGRAPCGRCSGSGRTLRHNKKSTTVIQCSVCRGGGMVACGRCGGPGSVACWGCSGSGHQLAFLTYRERSRWEIAIEPRSPIVGAHPQLEEERPLAAAELDAFTVVTREDAEGPVILTGYRDVHRPVLEASVAALDHRLERIHRQQYVSLAVVRRDVRYAMCGLTGEVVLSGKRLAASPTDGALRPIRRRNRAWLASVAVVAAGAGGAFAALRGESAYFARSNAWSLALASIAACAAIPSIGGALRSLRSGRRFSPLRPLERYAAVASIAVFAAMAALGYAARPTPRELASALAAGDVRRARLVVDALRERRAPGIEELEDSVTMAEAGAAAGADRLRLFDAVASRGGSRSKDAAVAARAERLAEIRRDLDAHDPRAALAKVDDWFAAAAGARDDAEAAELRACSYDDMGAACGDDPCRLAQAERARAAAPAEARAARERRVSEVRGRLLDVLRTSDVPGEAKLARLARLRSIAVTAAAARSLATLDAEVAARASSAETWALAERARVPLLGAELPVVEELLGGAAVAEDKSMAIAVGGVRVRLALDGAKACRGLRASVGAVSGSAAAKSLERLASQALGRTVTLRAAPAAGRTTRWWEGGAPIVVSWSDGAPSELAVGSAPP